MKHIYVLSSGSLHFVGRRKQKARIYSSMTHMPKKLQGRCCARGTFWGDFLEEGLEEETQRNADDLDQVPLCCVLLIPGALMCKMSAHMQLFCTQPSSVTRFMPTVLVRGKEWDWVTARTNGILSGRKQNRERKWSGIIPGTANGKGWERTTGKDDDAVFIVNWPAFQMSPEDTATISMQPDAHSDYTFWLGWRQ